MTRDLHRSRVEHDAARLSLKDAHDKMWEGLALFMDEHELHGIALQELKISD